MADAEGRLHTSMNINTETGRLSSRRPNLQNQPALEKDRYKIRGAFIAEEGNALVVADYGQLELRLLAHMSRCKSMLEAFASGGDFHSRTALGMYEHIRAAVAAGECRVESTDAGDAPLVKDVFSSERRRAKTLNFSIAYGKTARGLSKDWETSLADAKSTLEAWYADRPEVREWQRQVIAYAIRTGVTKTLMGRMRRLPSLASRLPYVRAHGERAAINTPLQGGAADIVMCAMLRIAQDPWLREHNFRQVLQVHDEILVEGPESHAVEARERIVELMMDPFEGSRNLLIDLVVDANIGKTWAEAK